MRVLYGEGIASHAGPESCVAARKDRGEALTGESTGRVLSREITISKCRRRHPRRKATPRPSPSREGRGRARSETPSMYGSFSRGNREVPCLPTRMVPWAAEASPKGVTLR